MRVCGGDGGEEIRSRVEGDGARSGKKEACQ